MLAALLSFQPAAWSAAAGLSAPTVPNRQGPRLPSEGMAPVPEVVGQPVEVQPQDAGDLSIWLRGPYPDEEFRGAYGTQDGGLAPEAAGKIARLMRCKGTGQVKEISRALIELLAAIQRHFKGARIEVLCGYRSPERNKLLRKRSRRVAKESLHMEGLAADIRVAGVSTRKLRDFAVSLRVGGVGAYRKRGFVHVDVGPVRTW